VRRTNSARESRAAHLPNAGGQGFQAELRALFLLAPNVVHLNHGAYGACPRPVFDAYQSWQRQLEHHPTALLSQRYDALLDRARARLADYLNCSSTDVVFVPNATTGLNAVARSLRLEPGDEVLATDQEYDAMDLLWSHVCAEASARYVRRPLPLPTSDRAELVERIWSAVTRHTRVIFMSHVTSKTALILPVAEICRRARAAGIMTVIDGAHGPGQLELDLGALDPDVYAASCHKWLCAPRGSGFLYVRPEAQHLIQAPVLSHGSTMGSDFVERNRWQGTRDPSAFLAVPAAIEFQEAKDWSSVRSRCHDLARAARSSLSRLFGLPPLTPDAPEWFAQMVSAQLPPCDPEDIRDRLFTEHRIDAPVREWNGRHLIRLSFQAYNTPGDLERLLGALRALFAKSPRRDRVAR
jgi:isopenicillin-N epimerase